MTAFGAYARYYDLLYRDKDYQAEAIYLHGLIQQHAPGAASILDLGCGTGAHAAQFAKLGYEVLGVDSSPDMLQRACSRRAGMDARIAPHVEFVQGDACSFRAGRRFEVVTTLFHVLSYQLTNEDLRKAFATVAEHLIPGGIFLFDFWYGAAVLSDPPVARVKRLQDATTRIERHAKPTMYVNQNLVEVNYQILVTDSVSDKREEIREKHRLRYLFLPEIECWAEKSGLTIEASEEWETGRPLSQATWSALIVARKQQPGPNGSG